MTQAPFAHTGTRQKLDTVFDYAEFYVTALRGKGFCLQYFDAFAGTGEVPFSADMPLLDGVANTDEVVVGSARRALQVKYPFARYVFAEKKKSNAFELEKLKTEFPSLSDRIKVVPGNANDVVRQFCSGLRALDRALVFLDPFGNQVRWETLEALASTKKVDVWYLFPAWIGVARQIKNSGEILADAEPSIDAMFGPHDWRSKCVQQVEPAQSDFFGNIETEQKKIAKADDITRFMIECMGTIFGGGVSQKWLPLGRNGRHYYSLLFACANPSGKAKSLAQKVANEIMTRK